MAELAKIGKILGFSLIEERNSKGRQSCSDNEGPKQVCVYRYYPHSNHLVQVLPPSATTEARIIFSGYETQFPERNNTPAVAF
ncbi:unnamed protein product [Withania somnifera]